jgi:DNA-binding FadR family transcriptional regulator
MEGMRMGRSLHDELTDALGEKIVAGTYEPGLRLTTDQIEADFGLSRTVVRETLRVLESMGLVSARRSIGITVREQSNWNVYDPKLIRWRLAGPHRAAQLASLTTLRLAVEPLAARAAAQNGSRRDRDELIRLADLLERTGSEPDLNAFLDYDIAFHSLILRASGNEMFTSLSAVIAEVLIGRTVHHLMPEEPDPEARRLHSLVASSVQAGHGMVAEIAMRELLNEVAEVLLPGESTAATAATA